MRGRTQPLATLVATGAGVLLAATMVGCAPAHDRAPDASGTSTASPAAPLTGKPVDVTRRSSADPGAASRSLQLSGRRAVAPLRFPGWPALDRVSLLASGRPADASRDADLLRMLPAGSPSWTIPVRTMTRCPGRVT